MYCAAQELQRCQEELQFLPQDAVNMLRYWAWQQEQLAAALATIQEQQHGGARFAAMLAAGQAHQLQAWQARVAVMQ